MFARCAVVWMVVPCLLAGQEYAGAHACQSCHPQQAKQLRTNHALALRPILDSPLPALLAGVPIEERSGLRYSYAPAEDGLAVTVAKDGRQLTAILNWAFGAGAQALTPVGFREGAFFEHRVSYYTAGQQPGRTLGHPGTPARILDEAFGIAQPMETIRRCFGCHAARVTGSGDLAGIEPGVTCERCHGPGAAHASSQVPMQKFSGRPAAETVNFCAECHRSPEGERVRPDDAMAIRFQPIGLMASKCFQKSGRLSCISCHNPHENASHDEQHYVRICAGCHPPSTVSRPGCGRATKQNCLPCHMPQSSPAPMLTFTNHRIGNSRK